MLSIPSDFGQVGSWVLYDRPGDPHAARILAVEEKDGDRVATISLADVPHLATGQLEVPLAQLVDPTPLNPAERDELARLAAYLDTLAQPQRSSRVARFDALKLRLQSARRVADMLARLNRNWRLATKATREGQLFFEAGLAEIEEMVARIAA